MDTKATRILLVEDHPLFARGLRQVIEEEQGMEVVGAASDSREALALVRSAAPDVVVMDIHLDAEDGLEISRQLLAEFPAKKVVVLSGDASLDVVREALQAGVSAYITKADAPAEVARAIRAVLDHRLYLCPKVADLVASDYLKTMAEKTIPASKPLLTERENQLLKLVAEGKRNKDIAPLLGIGVKSVETYRGRLMKKLGCASSNELTRYALRHGIASL